MTKPLTREDAIDEAHDFNPSTARGLSNAEKQGSDSPYVNSGTDQAEAYANDLANATKSADDVQAAESNPSGSWNTNIVDQKGFNKSPNRSPMAILKKAGPAGAISGILVTAGITLSMLFSPSLLLIHMKELIVGKFNIQSTTLDSRANKILAKKMASVATSGCSATSITQKCKFSKMSNKMLKSLAENKIVPLDGNGRPLEIKDGWGSDRPKSFSFDTGEIDPKNGKSITKVIKAGEMGKFLRDNPAAAGVFRKVFNPNWSAFWDSKYSEFLKKVGFGSRGSKITGESEKALQASFDDAANGAEKAPVTATSRDQPEEGTPEQQQDARDANARAQANASEAGDLATRAGSETAETLAEEIAAKLRIKGAGPTTLALNLYCLAGSGEIEKVVRGIQMAKYIAYGLLFLQVADEIKAGHGDAAKVSLIGTMLTKVLADSKGNVTKKSAMSSDLMNYALTGDRGFKSKTSNAKQYLPGGGATQILSELRSKLSLGGVTSNVCKGLNSTAGQIGQLAVDFNPLGLLLFVLAPALEGPIASLMAPLLGMMAGNIVNSALEAEDLGNVAGVGMIQAITEGGNAGGTMPMTVSQATTYAQATRETQLANAKVDRAVLSPLDASSPNTFLGSIYSKFLPYAGNFSSLSGSAGTVMSIVGSTFSSLITPASFATQTAADFTGCDDPNIKEAGIAAGAACEVSYGIPVEYLNSIDPESNTDYLTSLGMIDQDGNLVEGSELKEYVTNCATGDGTSAKKECVINDELHARYAIFPIDRRLQRDMDGEDVVDDSSIPATSAGDDVPSKFHQVAEENWRRTTSGEPHIAWLGMIPGQCAAFSAWRAAKIWYGTALNADGSNLEELVNSKPMIPGHTLNLGNGSEIANLLISSGVADSVPSLAQSQPGDIVSMRSRSIYGHTYVIMSNDGSKIMLEDYNAAGGHDRYGTATVSSSGFYSESTVVAIARVHAGGGQ